MYLFFGHFHSNPWPLESLNPDQSTNSLGDDPFIINMNIFLRDYILDTPKNNAYNRS